MEMVPSTARGRDAKTSVASQADLPFRDSGRRIRNTAALRLQRGLRLAIASAVAILEPRSFAHTRSTDVSWTKDIEPIVRARCATCHAPGGQAQTSLVTYRDARTNARAIREEVLEGRMPPWPAARGLGDF